jgi:RNA polymerase sigma-70 factor (ECF subfamily)
LGGDEHAFEILVTRYQGPIYNAVLRMVRDRDDASDLTQNAFLKAFQQLSRFDPQYKFFSWLYRIAINESLNFVKRSGRQEPLESDGIASDPDPERIVVSAEVGRHVQDALMKIAPDYRAVIVLRHFHDCAYDEMAAILGIPEKTVKSRLFSARRQLRELLEAKGMLP